MYISYFIPNDIDQFLLSTERQHIFFTGLYLCLILWMHANYLSHLLISLFCICVEFNKTVLCLGDTADSFQIHDCDDLADYFKQVIRENTYIYFYYNVLLYTYFP